MSDHPHIRRLAAYRLAHDLTFAQLAAEMTAAGYPVRTRALNRTLTVRTAPRERTLYKIAQFVATLEQEPAPRTLRRRTASPKDSKRKPRGRAAA